MAQSPTPAFRYDVLIAGISQRPILRCRQQQEKQSAGFMGQLE